MLHIAQSTYYERRAIARDRASARAKSDSDLCTKIVAAWKDNRKLYGARKIWHVLLRDDEAVARCTVERLMRRLGQKGVLRGKKIVTTNADTSQPCPDDKVKRLFMADRSNKLWVSDFTYVQTWSGTVCVASVIDVFARRIMGWRASTSMKTQFVLDALEQAIWQRKTPDNKSLVHHSDRGSQYLSIKYTERLAPSRALAAQDPARQWKQRSISPLEPSAMPTIMPLWNASSAFSKLRSSTRSARGNRCATSNGKP